MCLVVKSGPHISTKNITVYKILQKYWHSDDESLIGFSPYQGFAYDKNTSYFTKFKKSEEKQYRIFAGFHAYISKKEADYHFHPQCNQIIVKMTIPAYTKYYRGFRGDIVSEIIITGTPR